MSKKDTIKEIEAIVEDLKNDGTHLRQEFITFKSKELQALRDLTTALQEKMIISGKSRIIAVACRYLLEELKSEKNGNKKV